MNLTHLKITPALLLAAGTSLITLLVSVVPAWAPEKQLLVTILGATLTLGGLVANAVHKLGDSNVSARDVEQGAINLARAELGKVDFDALAKAAIDAHGVGDLEALAKAEVQKAIAGLEIKLSGAPATVAPVVAEPLGPSVTP